MLKGEEKASDLLLKIGYGILLGGLVGAAISIFRKLVIIFQGKMKEVFGIFRMGFTNALLGLIFIGVLGLIVGIFTQKEKFIGGSGIPQVSGQIKNGLEMDWKRVFPLKFLGGLIGLSAGLTVGREGPSVQMGASLGQGLADIFKKDKEDKNLFISAGAAAGLAAAFNAPLSGIVFVLEELNQKFEKYLFLISAAAAISADIIAGIFFGTRPVIDMGRLVSVEFYEYGYIIILALIIGVLSKYFIKGIYHVKRIYERVRLETYLKVTFAFLLSGIVILIWPEMFGSGEEFIFLALGENVEIYRQIVILLAKFSLLLLAFCSGMPGGIFLPMLVLGALIGNIFGSCLLFFGMVNSDFVIVLSIIGMAANFSAIVRSPITAMLLIIELTGAFTFFLPLVLGVLVSYVVIESINIKAIYEILLEMLLEKNLG
ncbi:MAG: ClC family H(+)/Cl(-) exchange transporter [Tissierellia bacterium]|nr:ClC family H(+)/Cl(-) exchange transporter [Tissierellia bacterium]